MKHWLNRTVLGIGLASLFADIGHELATCAMPALLASLGGASAALGIIEGIADGLASFAKLLSGVYSDRLARRKPLAVLGYVMTASGMASFALATQWWHILLGRTAGWLGRGVRKPVRNVLLAEATTPETYGRVFGFERAMDCAGAVIGPSMAIYLIHTVGLKSLFALTLIPGLAAAMCIAFLVREKPHTLQQDRKLSLSLYVLPREFRQFLLGVGIAGLGDFSNAFLILWATQAFTPHYGLETAASYAVLFYIGYNAIYMVSCYANGLLADRFSKKWVLAIGYSLAVIPAAALMVPGDSFVKFAVVFAASGWYMGVWETVESSTAAMLLPSDVRGTGFGVLATVNGIGDLFSSIIVGALWVISPVAAMGFVMAASLIGAAIIARTHPITMQLAPGESPGANG